MAGDEVIDMVSVWHCFMSARGAMAMSGLMPLATMGRRTCSGVLPGDVEPMFIDMVAVDVVQVAVVQIIGVAIMRNGRVAAVGSMLMVMLIMNCVVIHGGAPFVVRVVVQSGDSIDRRKTTVNGPYSAI